MTTDAPIPPTTPTVLLALDETDASHLAALTATTLFGPGADYIAVHAEDSQIRPIVWGPVFGYPYPAVTADRLHEPEQRQLAVAEARQVAAQEAAALGIDATPVGEVGNPVAAIERAAIDHGADVVVVGAHQRSWFRKLFEDSVSKDLIAAGRRPILVVPGPADDT